MTSLGSRVRVYRTQLNMNLRELSKACGLSPSKLSRVENGQSKTFDMDSLKKLANALGVSIGQLIGDAPTAQPESTESVDQMARRILSGYRKLSPASREKLRDLLVYLEASEARKKGQA
jgi:transcriptional regulator with XRE-family HTH domain